MPKNNPMQRIVSIVPAIYIHVAGGLKPAFTKKSSVAGTVIFPIMGGMKNTAQVMRRMLNSLNRLNLSASDMVSIPPGGLYQAATFDQIRTSRRSSQPRYNLRPLSHASPFA